MGKAAHQAAQAYSLEAAFEDFWSAHDEVWRRRLASIGIREGTPRPGRRGRSQELRLVLMRPG